MIEFRDVSFSYIDKKKSFKVFSDVSFEVAAGQFFCIIGQSGCGKTTLIRTVAGFEKPTFGTILHNGTPIAGIDYRRAMVFQEDAVFPWMTVRGNVEYGLKARGIDREHRDKIVDHYIRLVDLQGFENAYPKELSGGMRKRVDLARVLANDPELLLMDEPFGALDAMTKEVMQEKLVEIWEKTQKTILFITHDIEEALFLGDRLAIMQKTTDGTQLQFYDIPFKRPRDIRLKEMTEFQQMRRMLVTEFSKCN